MATVVKSNLKAHFLIATTQKCKRGHYSSFWIAPLTLDPYLIMLSVKQGSIKYDFLSLWYASTWDWTLVSCPVSWTNGEHFTNYTNGPVYIYIHIYIHDSGLKSSYADIISAIDDFFDKWDPSTVTLIKEMCGLHGGLCLKINLIQSHSMIVSYSAYELFRRPLYAYIHIYIYIYIFEVKCLSLWLTPKHYSMVVISFCLPSLPK